MECLSKKLLENDDFVKGARIIEMCVSTNPVCRISNADQLLDISQSIDYRKPQWWFRGVRSYWLSMGAVSIVSSIIIYSLMINFGLWPLEYLILSLIVGIPMYAFSYYIRTIATKRMWRVIYIMLGACGIGFWCIILPTAFLLGPIIGMLPFWLGFPLMTIPPVVVGAYIGDWLGKRRDYMPYM